MKVVEKPWGKEEWIEVNDKYVVKRLTMKKDCRCSLQYHEKKMETLYVLSGTLRVLHGDAQNALQELIMKPGDTLTLPPRKIHRMEGVEDAVYLEASTNELDDVVRLQDDYQRA